jgi:ABC-type transport system involved in multi-copper enzyme maturation permease subunit
MTVLPAIERELRAQARLPFTYGLRVLGVSALLAVSLLFALESGFTPSAGGALFGWLNLTLFLSIWMIVPLLAADCISRERREGTIGLLFLTPLNARDIVLAKGLVHGLRAITLWLAAIPLLAVPFLMGGLGRRELLLSVLFNFSSICLALAAGLLASAVSKNWLRAQILAGLLSFSLVCVLIAACGYMFEKSVAFKPAAFTYVGASSPVGQTNAPHQPHFAPALMGPSFYYGNHHFLPVNRETLPIVGFFGISDFENCWTPMLGSMSPAGQSSWLETVGWLTTFSLLTLVVVIEIAARRLRHIWQEEPPSAAQLWLEEVLCAPVIGATFLRWWMHRKLDVNPIGWLEQRSWSGRMVMWGWLAVMVSLYCTFLTGTYAFEIVYRLQNIMAWLLLIGLAASAAGSFQRERETGVMELLLVSPIPESKIIWGRMRGLWGQFLPALALLLAAWAYLNRWTNPSPNSFAWIRFYCIAFITLPVIGLYHSLRWKSFVSAFLMTFCTGILLPLGVALPQSALLFSMFHSMGFNAQLTDFVGSSPIANLMQLIFALIFARGLARSLRNRNFAISKPVT